MNTRSRFPAPLAGKTIRLLALAALVAAFGGRAVADSDDGGAKDYERAKRLQESGEILPLERILDKARGVYPGGKILEVEFEDKKGRLMYEIEVLTTDGVVQEMYFDAKTGELKKTKREK